MYQTIRPVAYEPDPAQGPWHEQLHVLRLGEDLRAALVRRYEFADGHAGRPLRLPVNRLNSLLRAMAPGVLATGRNAGTDGRLPWLYAREAVPRRVLAPVLGTWATSLSDRDDEDESDGCDLEEELLADNAATEVRLPTWETEKVDLTETVMSPGGTAEPTQRLYSLLPESIAFRLAARPYRARGAALHFRVVSSGNGAELVSWPPLRYEHRKQTWYYSARVNITVHTVPFAASFRVHVSTGVRRWVTRPDVRARELSGATVLLDAPLPWPDGPNQGYRLTANTLVYDRRRKEITWRRHSPVLALPELDIVRHYPEPAELLASAEKWINGQHDVAAGIVHHTTFGTHEVGSGLMPRERSELDAWVEEGLRPVLRRVGDLTRVTRSNTPSLLPRSVENSGPDTREVRKALLRRAALARALDGRPLDVEIVWQAPETRTALLTELPKLIGLAPGSGVAQAENSWQWRSEGIEINLRTRPAGALVDALRISGDRRRRRAVRLAEAITDRCAFVAERMDPPRSEVSLVVAEIPGKGAFATAPDSDPKHALRIAWARQGRLSQFVNPADDHAANTLGHRARWTWLDAFRQLGAISPPAHRVGAGIPGDLQYAALWLVRYTKKGPTRCPARRLVAVRVRPDNGPGTIEGWKAERAEWVPYPQLLLSLAQEEHQDEGAEHQWQQETERQIRTLLFQLRGRPTLLLVGAGNLRQCWPRLRNGALARDMLGFGAEPDQPLRVHGEDLRAVLVRDANGRFEVAEWYAHDGPEKIGFSEGVWASAEPENRVFASTAGTPHTVAKLPKGLRKLVPTKECPTAPGKTAWNPAQLEVTVLGCLSEKALADSGREGVIPDRPAEWATLVHQLRYHDDYPPLARPLPLHLAYLAGQYVLPLVDAEQQHG
ncbi:pPIWI_RE module domain-containing protein [Streptomyces sp. NPDC017529]|uniref:pPIWI_RE module domain-containing protein n=1 Tax=Streptomyces sp. NPDC017529 TaxID=3365000 RepID=UPI0037957BC2